VIQGSSEVSRCARTIRAAIVCAATLLAGCMPPRPLMLADAPVVPLGFVTDATVVDSYPAPHAGEMNIYSCRYGIALQGAGEFQPPKPRMFEALLAAEWPEIQNRQVVLHRFDVYDNSRAMLLGFAGRVMGGAMGAGVAASGQRADGKQSGSAALRVDIDPGPIQDTSSEQAVGCSGAGEGEYLPSQASAGHRVVVTWLRFDVDGTPYHLRTLFPYPNPESPSVALERSAAAKLEAVRQSVRAAAARVRQAT